MLNGGFQAVPQSTSTSAVRRNKVNRPDAKTDELLTSDYRRWTPCELYD